MKARRFTILAVLILALLCTACTDAGKDDQGVLLENLDIDVATEWIPTTSTLLTSHFFSYDPQGDDRLSEFARAAQDGKCYMAPACIIASYNDDEDSYAFKVVPCPIEYGDFMEVECAAESQ